MTLDAVHHDVEPGLGGQVHEPDELVHGGGADEGAVGLEQRPQVKDPDVVQAEVRYLGEILAGGRRVEVVPGVEPAAARGVVDAEARGSADGVLLRGLCTVNVSTTMVANEQ
jgi:hypothetical protein